MKRRQAGMSLISLMVGLTLSMVALVALLYAYRGIVVNTKSVTTQGRNQAQVTSSLLAVEQLIQQAGWGSGPTASPPGGTANTNLVLLSGASLSGSTLSGTPASIATALQSGNALVWDNSLSGTTRCTALLIARAGITRYGPVDCTSAAAWSTLAWQPAVAMVQPQALAANAQFQAQLTDCWPYGGGPNGLQTVAQVTLANIGSSAPSVCLVNISH